MPDNQARVFVSHASEDAECAWQVVRELEKRGVPCWLARRDVAPSVSYPVAIMEAAQKAPALILILSRHASLSKHVPREVERMDHLGKPLFSLKIDHEPPSKELEYFLSIRQQVDMVGGVQSESMDRLAEQLKALDTAAIPGDDRAIRSVKWTPSKLALRLKPLWAVGAAALAVSVVGFGWYFNHPPFRGDPLVNVPGKAHVAEAFTYSAVVIGISDYRESEAKDATGWRDLPSARGDAEAIAKVLEETYGFSVTRLFDEKASRSAILAAFDGLATAGSNTAALICFSGHGTYEGTRKEGYWIPADARKTVEGRPAREDWIWNSTIQKIVGASDARHILLIADACYAGTLFRPDDLGPQGSERTGEAEGSFADVSRYLIASGGVEEVPDGGLTRSAFMQAVLDEMKASASTPLTAQSLGRSVRGRLHKETGREIAVGPLTVSAGRNGQFVFARRGVLSDAMRRASALDNPGKGAAMPAAPTDMEEMLTSVLALNRDGATNAAIRLLASLSGTKTPDDGMLRAVAAYIDHDRRAQSGVEMRALMDNLKKIRAQQAVAGPAAGQAAPRILACIGPTAPPGASSDVENRTMLCRIVLQSQVKASGRAVVVEREELEQILKEMQLGTTDLSDPRTRVALGRMLQAGVLLFGDYLPGETEDTLILRLVETETTQLLDSITGTLNPRTPAAACISLGKHLVETLIRSRPVHARATEVSERKIRIAAGRLQGVAPNSLFDLLGEGAQGGATAAPFARAMVKQVSEEESELELVDGSSLGNRTATSILACEVAPVPRNDGP